MTAPFWDVIEEGYGSTYDHEQLPWSVCLLSDLVLPGYAEVEAEPQRAVDKKKASGRNGGTLTFHGVEAGTPVTIRLYMWRPDQWQTWQTRTLPALWPAESKSEPEAFDISHPALAGLGIKSVAVVSVSSLRPGRVPGEQMVTIKCAAWAKPSKKTATKTIGSSTSSATNFSVVDNFRVNQTSVDGRSIDATPQNQPVKPSLQAIGPNT